MKVKQITIENQNELLSKFSELTEINPQVIIAFGGISYFEDATIFKNLHQDFPHIEMIGCSSAGEIDINGVNDKTLVLTALCFDHPDFKIMTSTLSGNDEACGAELAKKLKADNLNGVIVLAQGVNINGSSLINGIYQELDSKTIVTGGLAGDEAQFSKTYTLIAGEVSTDKIIGLGIYGDHLEIGHGSMGGWSSFGPVRKVTKNDGNILQELDNEPALEVYKKYLGEYSKDLPASGLLFPFAILNDENEDSGLIRTILGIDEETGSLTLAGDVPNGGLLRLMHAKDNDLKDGALTAAKMTQNTLSQPLANNEESLALLVSCVGRKLVMMDEIDDEIDAVKEIFPNSMLTGFYSNGEICPHKTVTDCQLHNQTMTITLLREK